MSIDIEIDEDTQDQSLRADCYLFLAGLLNRTPAQEQLDALAQMPADESTKGAIADAWRSLSNSAQSVSAASADEEFFKLFVGLGRGELVPFGSWYITGFLQEQPLSDLRDTLQELGLARIDGDHNTEDHISQELAVMATMIVNPEQYSLAQQQQFFQSHLEPWAERFFRDLAQSKSASFYRSIGALGEAFYNFEKQYLAMPA